MFTFTFSMPDTNVHFKGIFTKTEDKTEIKTQSQSISSASISNGANAAGSGNLQLTVADSTGYDMTAAQQKVAGAVSAQAVELDLNQIVAKGDGTNWETKITEFTNPITRPFYRLELDAAGLSVWMAGEQNKTEPTNRYTWNTVYCAYRTKEAVYIYVQKNQAYLLNESMDAAWSLLGSTLPAASLHDCRK